MNVCPKCGKDVGSKARFCGGCGSSLTRRTRNPVPLMVLLGSVALSLVVVTIVLSVNSVTTRRYQRSVDEMVAIRDTLEEHIHRIADSSSYYYRKVGRRSPLFPMRASVARAYLDSMRALRPCQAGLLARASQLRLPFGYGRFHSDLRYALDLGVRRIDLWILAKQQQLNDDTLRADTTFAQEENVATEYRQRAFPRVKKNKRW